MTFSLTTTFTQEALALLNGTGTNIVVAKPSIGGNLPNVAWIVFRPLPSNILTWEEQYGIYASTQSIQNGATLTQMATSPFPASDGMIYSFGANGFFGPPQSGGTPGSFTAKNMFNNLPPAGPGFMTLGLYQNATMNGNPIIGNAVSAASVIYNSTALMTPLTSVYIWTQSQIASNTVVTLVTSPQTIVTFGGTGDITDITLSYNPQTGTFVIQQEASGDSSSLAAQKEELPAGVSLSYRMPLLH